MSWVNFQKKRKVFHSHTEPFFWQSEELDKKGEKSDDIVIMPKKLEQKYIMVPEDVRDSYLVHLIKLLLEEKLDEKDQIIIFSRTCKSVQVLGMLLQKIGARACVLHSILRQKQRFAALEQFKVRHLSPWSEFNYSLSDFLFTNLESTFESTGCY